MISMIEIVDWSRGASAVHFVSLTSTVGTSRFRLPLDHTAGPYTSL
jgi:hypothetical protein